jgi:hypothetical protein
MRINFNRISEGLLCWDVTEVVTVGQRKWHGLHNEELYNLYSPPRMIRDSGVLRLGFGSRQCKMFLISKVPRPTLGPTKPHMQWVPWAVAPGIKRPGRGSDHTPPSSAEVKNGGTIQPLPHMSSWNSAWLIMQRDKFTLLMVSECVQYGVVLMFVGVVQVQTPVHSYINSK